MSFPKKRLFWTIGWKDLGVVERTFERCEVGGDVYNRVGCGLCHANVHVGKENNKVFLFCPRCMVKGKEKK